MADDAKTVPVKSTEKKGGAVSGAQVWRPFEDLHKEIDRLFDDFGNGFFQSYLGRPSPGMEPFRFRGPSLNISPAVDIAETDKAYEISADLPGLDEKNVEVKVANGMLTISGEKKEEKEEKKKDYHLTERSFGSFQRNFRLPDGVDEDNIDATFRKGVLKITLPKTPEARKAEKKIAIKAS